MLLQINKYYSFSTENDLRGLNSFKNTCEQLLWRLYVTFQLLRCNRCMCANMLCSNRVKYGPNWPSGPPW